MWKFAAPSPGPTSMRILAPSAPLIVTGVCSCAVSWAIRIGLLADDPLIEHARRRYDFIGLEKQIDLLTGLFGSVAGMHQVVLLVEPEVSADRAGGGFAAVCRPEQVAHDRDGAGGFEHRNVEPAAGPVAQQR